LEQGNKTFAHFNFHAILSTFVFSIKKLYSSAKGWTVPLFAAAGRASVAKQSRARYGVFFIAKSASRSGDHVQPFSDEYISIKIHSRKRCRTLPSLGVEQSSYTKTHLRLPSGLGYDHSETV
jgi:hypothetical protein